MTLIRQSNVDICALNEAQLSRAVDYSSRAALFHIFRILKIAPTSEVPGKKREQNEVFFGPSRLIYALRSVKQSE